MKLELQHHLKRKIQSEDIYVKKEITGSERMNESFGYGTDMWVEVLDNETSRRM
jgi:hypothetical protein